MTRSRAQEIPLTRILVTALIGALLAALWVAGSPLRADEPARLQVRFEQKRFHPQKNETTFSYYVVAGGDAPIRSFTAGFGLCAKLRVVEVAPAAYPGTPIRSVHLDMFDRSTRVHGVQWQGNIGAGAGQRFSYSVPGDVPLGLVEVGVTTSKPLTARVLGPHCDTQARPVRLAAK